MAAVIGGSEVNRRSGAEGDDNLIRAGSQLRLAKFMGSIARLELSRQHKKQKEHVRLCSDYIEPTARRYD
jgi:hypothetical protein